MQIQFGYYKSSGVGMIELLVAMIVVATGVIGLGALHLQATRASGSSTYYSQAVWAVNDLVGRLQSERLEDNANMTELFRQINSNANPIDCTRSRPPAPSGGAITPEITQMYERVFDALWQAGCPSDWRVQNPDVPIDATQNALANSLDWFSEPEMRVKCRGAALPNNFFVPDPANPKAVPAAQPPDCQVILTWAERARNPQSQALQQSAGGQSASRGSYTVTFQLGRTE